MTDPIDVASFRRNGWLVVPAALTVVQVDAIDAAVTQLERWAVDGGPGLHHFEQTDTGAVLARSEDFVHDDQVLHDLILGGVVVEILGALFGDDAALFKEKVNYKHPGGGGFAPHQDATAYRFVDHHISCMVPLDPATPASGCLYVAPGYEVGQLATDERGRIDEATAAQLAWQPVPLEPGDLLFFDSYTPHYSDTNTTTTIAARGLSHLQRRVARRPPRPLLRRQARRVRQRGRRLRGRARPDQHQRRLPGSTRARRPAMSDLDDLFALYASPAALRMYDEDVTELEHALQSAALATADGAPGNLVAAALLHDVGHLVSDDNVTLDDDLTVDFHHERVGAKYLARWFGPEVTAPVALHVAAKRYLCAVEAGYLDGLSASSDRSLRLQGGPMSDIEVEAFERRPHHREATLVRRWDDTAKVGGLVVAGLDDYRSLLSGLAGR